MKESEKTLDDARDLHARSAAQAAAERLVTGPTGVVTYTSRGRVLVIGGEAAQWFAARVESPLHAELLLTAGDDEPGVPTVALGGRRLAIDGHLGAFSVELGEPGTHNHQLIEADLIVDFSPQPLIDSELPAPGYWHFGNEPDDLDTAWLAIDGMHGTFEKPRYFAYDPAICAHSRSGQPGCRRCIDACPAEAIVSIGERVEVNPNLCQGGSNLHHIGRLVDEVTVTGRTAVRANRLECEVRHTTDQAHAVGVVTMNAAVVLPTEGVDRAGALGASGQHVGKLKRILFERHGDVESATAAVEETTGSSCELAELNAHSPVLDIVATLRRERRVNDRRLALLDGIAENGVLVSVAHGALRIPAGSAGQASASASQSRPVR